MSNSTAEYKIKNPDITTRIPDDWCVFIRGEDEKSRQEKMERFNVDGAFTDVLLDEECFLCAYRSRPTLEFYCREIELGGKPIGEVRNANESQLRNMKKFMEKVLNPGDTDDTQDMKLVSSELLTTDQTTFTVCRYETGTICSRPTVLTAGTIINGKVYTFSVFFQDKSIDAYTDWFNEILKNTTFPSQIHLFLGGRFTSNELVHHTILAIGCIFAAVYLFIRCV